MNRKDAEKWDQRYRLDGAQWLRQRPRRLLRDFVDRLSGQGLALDAAGGVATHGRLLAQRGWRVLTLDISPVGLRLAQQRAQTERLPLQTAVADLAAPLPLASNSIDLVINFRFLERSTFADYGRVLKPGGWLIFETFVRTDAAEPLPHYFLHPGELQAGFAGWIHHFYAETELIGRSGRRKVAAQLVAQKP